MTDRRSMRYGGDADILWSGTVSPMSARRLSNVTTLTDHNQCDDGDLSSLGRRRLAKDGMVRNLQQICRRSGGSGEGMFGTSRFGPILAALLRRVCRHGSAVMVRVNLLLDRICIDAYARLSDAIDLGGLTAPENSDRLIPFRLRRSSNWISVAAQT